MNLTAENTAIVLDSTSDFPDAAERFPNMRVVPLYVNFGAESFRDHVDIGSHDFYERLRERADAADDLAADAAGLPRRLRAAGGLRADLRAPALGEALRHLPVGGHGGRRGRRRPDPGRRHRDGVARGRPARARDPAPARARYDRRGDRGADRALQGARTASSSRSATLEYLQKGGRIGRAQALAGTLLNVKPILSVDDGVVHPIGKVRGRQKALEEFAPRLHVVDRERARACGSRSPTPTRRSGSRSSPTSSRRRGRRPRSSSSRTSAPSSAPMPAPAPSASSGSRTTIRRGGTRPARP